MELENIVANTVLLKAREGTFFFFIEPFIPWRKQHMFGLKLKITICDAKKKTLLDDGCLGGLATGQHVTAYSSSIIQINFIGLSSYVMLLLMYSSFTKRQVCCGWPRVSQPIFFLGLLICRFKDLTYPTCELAFPI